MRRSSAYRRSEDEKAKKRARRYYRINGYGRRELEDDWVNHTYKHLKMCSCWMCCNPRRAKNRKKDQLTLQEKRENDRLNEVRNENI